MAHRTSFIPVLGIAALIAGATVTRAHQPPAQPPLEKPAAAKPATQKPATAKPATQKPSTAKAAAEKPAAKQAAVPFPAVPPKAGVPRDRIVSISPGVDTQRFHPGPAAPAFRRRAGIGDGELVVVSPRTVANQLASAYRKLAIPGRSALR